MAPNIGSGRGEFVQRSPGFHPRKNLLARMADAALGAGHGGVEIANIGRAVADVAFDRFLHDERAAALGQTRQFVDLLLHLVREANRKGFGFGGHGHGLTGDALQVNTLDALYARRQ